MANKIKVFGIVDVPYNFTDERGNPRSGATRKAFVVEYEDSGAVHSAYTAKCVSGFDCPIKQAGFADYDKYGRLSGFRPAVS